MRAGTRQDVKRGLLLLALCVGLVGCGEESQDEKLSGALGGEGKQDAARLNDFLETAGRVTEADVAVMKAVNQGDLEAARTANGDLYERAGDAMPSPATSRARSCGRSWRTTHGRSATSRTATRRSSMRPSGPRTPRS
jgi:hypothetical protein